MNVIEIKNLTKDYGNNKGVFDISFSVKKGEIFGFLGPNGAGKTTTIRHLLGFLNADKGMCSINGIDCREKAEIIQKSLGYLPGEIAFFEDMKGLEFLKFIANLRGLKDLTKMNELIEYFELSPKGKIKKMSKGMKQKIGIVCAFMHNPEILILDEPTSGLDPLMQRKFVNLILEEKKKGKTILMSSHSFAEVEKTCDKVCIIKQGKIMALETVTALKQSGRKTYGITFVNLEDIEKFKKEGFEIKLTHNNYVEIVLQNDVNDLIKALVKYNILSIEAVEQNLEEIFMHYYGGDKNV